MDVFGYLDKFGKLSFEELPFSETDSLILSQLSYLKFEYGFSAISEGDEYVELTRFANLSDKTLLSHGTSDPVRYGEFWLKILKSPRFSTLKIGHIESVFNGTPAPPFNTGDGSSRTLTYTIPSNLRGVSPITIWMRDPGECGFYSYNYFYNATTNW